MGICQDHNLATEPEPPDAPHPCSHLRHLEATCRVEVRLDPGLTFRVCLVLPTHVNSASARFTFLL